MSRYTLSPEAKEDLRLIREYLIGEGGKRLARHVLEETRSAFELLANHPGIGHS